MLVRAVELGRGAARDRGRGVRVHARAMGGVRLYQTRRVHDVDYVQVSSLMLCRVLSCSFLVSCCSVPLVRMSLTRACVRWQSHSFYGSETTGGRREIDPAQEGHIE